MLSTLAATLDAFGLIVFAISGALVASRQQMDVLGFMLLAVVTGVGGGTIRDLLLGIAPVFWVRAPEPVALCAGVAALMFFAAHIPQSRMRLILWLDAAGLALFAVTGAERAAAHGAGPLVTVTMGVVTATFGGIIRDILGGEEPILRRPEIYVTAALLGAATFVAASTLGAPDNAALVAGFLAAFGLRAAALVRGWTLPRYRPRAGRP